MALTFDGWTMVARQALSAATAAACLTAIESMVDGVNGWAVEVDADTFGIALTPPGAGLDDDIQYIIAGKAASIGTPTMALVNNVTALDTATTGVLLAGMVHGLTGATPSALNWDAASPLGAGTFTGFVRGVTCASNGYITIYVSSESIAIVLDNNANNSTKWIILGPWIDPLSVNAGDCMTNGRLYCMYVSGSVATTGMTTSQHGSTVIANSSTNNRFLDHGTADGNAHCLFVDPATGYNQVMTRSGAFLSGTNANLLSAGNRYHVPRIHAYASATGKSLGVTRNFGWHQQGRHAQARSINTGTIGSPSYETGGSLLGTGLTSDQDALFMQAVEALA